MPPKEYLKYQNFFYVPSFNSSNFGGIGIVNYYEIEESFFDLNHDNNLYLENFSHFLNVVADISTQNIFLLISFFSDYSDHNINCAYQTCFKNKPYIDLSENRFFTEHEKKLIFNYYKLKKYSNSNDIKNIIEKSIKDFHNEQSDLFSYDFPFIFIGNKQTSVLNQESLTFFFKDDNEYIENSLILPYQNQTNSINFYGKNLNYIKISQISIETLNNSLLSQLKYPNYLDDLKRNIKDEIIQTMSDDTKTKLLEYFNYIRQNHVDIT